MFPGWNSIESAAYYAKIFTYLGWAALFLLGIFEILAHTYQARKDTLVGVQEQSTKEMSEKTVSKLTEQLETFKGQAEESRKLSIEAEKGQQAIAEKLQESSQELEEIRQRQAPRHLSKDQINRLAQLLSGTPSPLVDIIAITGVDDGKEYSADFVSAMSSAGWNVGPKNVGQGIMSPEPTGIGIQVRSRDDPAAIPAGILQKALIEIGVPAPGAIDRTVRPGRVRFVIGPKAR